jgi:peptide/nickel transport system ATP-binding protein
MYAGQFVETGSVSEVFHAPMHPYTQGLLSCIPVPGKTARGSRLGAIPGMVPSLIGDLHGCAFRSRCPHAESRCAADVALRQNTPSRGWRCVLDDNILQNYAQESATV